MGMSGEAFESLKIDKTLAQQMRITDFEVEMRKRLFEISPEDAETLKSLKGMIANSINAIVEEFYAGQREIPEIALLIGDSETFRRLQSSMRGYVLDLFSGVYDAEYVNRRLRIGKVHNRIGVSPKLYIFSMYALERILFRHIQSILDFDGREAPCQKCNDYREALRKLLAFDLHLVMETYIQGMVDEIDAARNDVTRYAESLEAIVDDRTRQLQGLTRRDDLTGVGNQRAFYEDLRRELAVATRQSMPITLVYFDLNKFKKLNDEKGHQAGDAVLRLVGHAMNETIRETDLAYRYGGDEFAAILPNTPLNDAKVFCVRLMNEFDKGETEEVTFSIGMVEAGHEVDYPDADSFLKLADASMYRAKEHSRETGQHAVDEGGTIAAE